MNERVDRFWKGAWWTLLGISIAGMFAGISGTLPARRSSTVDPAFIMAYSPSVITITVALLLLVACTRPQSVRSTSTAYAWGWLAVVFPAVGMIRHGGMVGTAVWFAGAAGVSLAGAVLLRRSKPARKDERRRRHGAGRSTDRERLIGEES